jgi:hypothetical protein
VLPPGVDQRAGLPVTLRSGHGRDGSDQQQRWNNGRDSEETHRGPVIQLLIWTHLEK